MKPFWTPARLTALTFFVAILVGSILLVQPWATRGDVAASFIDAVFTATSAACVTGLIVQDTPNFFSTYGHIVILFLIQIGGLSIMTLSAAIPIIFGKSLKIGHRELISRHLDLAGYVDESGYIKLLFILKKILKYTIIIESVGALILTLRFYTLWGDFWKALGYGIFHSVAAFCNAGFALFSDSLIQYRNDPIILCVILALIVLGGLGFLVIYDIFSPRRFREYSFHSKLVLLLTAVIILFPSIYIFFIEFSHSFIHYHFTEKIFSAIFYPISARTAGFNINDINDMHPSSIFIICILMFLGAAPGSTAGGVKITTVGILFLSIRSVLLGREQIEIFGRRITQNLVTKATAAFSLYSVVQILSIIFLLITESNSFRDIIFESISALGTVGLSLGVTPHLSFFGKIIVCFTMYFGRVGPLIIVFLIGTKEQKLFYKYPEGNVVVG